MKVIDVVISKADYLLEQQKNRLLDDFESSDVSEETFKLKATTLIDEFLNKLMGMRLSDLSTEERMEVDKLIREVM